MLSASDLQFLTAGAKQLGLALERAHRYDLIRDEHSRLEQELDMARKMQISLFPEELPEITGYSLAAFWQPAHETSGDYYNVFKLPGGRWGLIIADVCGKGAPAALRMAMAHGLIRERVESETFTGRFVDAGKPGPVRTGYGYAVRYFILWHPGSGKGYFEVRHGRPPPALPAGRPPAR